MPSTPNVTGKAVNRPVIMKISQTWFASQTGPIASATATRCSLARGPLAKRSQTPPPKSAPASTAYAVRASQRMPAMSSALLIGTAAGGAGSSAQHEQEPRGRDRQRRVDDDEDRERQAERGRGGRSLGRAHDAVHDPWLATELGHEPASFHGGHARWAG